VYSKTPNGTNREYIEGKHTKAECAVTGQKLHGVVSGSRAKKSKFTKSMMRPSVPFGGILSSSAREAVFIEIGKVAAGIKSVDDVDEKYRKYVKQALKRAL
jgi:ribosomal protein L34E